MIIIKILMIIMIIIIMIIKTYFMEGSSRGLSEGMVREKARCNTVTVCRQTAADEVAQIFLCLYLINSYVDIKRWTRCVFGGATRRS